MPDHSIVVYSGKMKVLAVFLLMALAVLGRELEEERGLSQLPKSTPSNKKYYPETTKKLSWEDALKECKARNMKLVTINSQAEQDQMIKAVKEKKPHSAFWTAGTVRGESEFYFWNSTGEAITYTNWRQGEPNPFGEFRCILVNSGGQPKWMFYNCSAKEFFICEQ